jgi:hypothetical protein
MIDRGIVHGWDLECRRNLHLLTNSQGQKTLQLRFRHAKWDQLATRVTNLITILDRGNLLEPKGELVDRVGKLVEKLDFALVIFVNDEIDVVEGDGEGGLGLVELLELVLGGRLGDVR